MILKVCTLYNFRENEIGEFSILLKESNINDYVLNVE